MLEILSESVGSNRRWVRSVQLLFASLLFSACTTVPTTRDTSPFAKASTKIHESLVINPDNRSLCVVMEEMTQILQSTFPEADIQTDVQLSYQSEKGQVAYVVCTITVNGKQHTTSLTAQRLIDEKWDKVSAADVAEKIIWDMREAYRNYLDNRIDIIPDIINLQTRDEKFQRFLEEEKEALKKHWLTFSGKITFVWDIIRIYFHDEIHHWKKFEYTFLKDLSLP